MAVPRLDRPVRDLHEANAALHQPSGQQQRARLFAGTVCVDNTFGLTCHVEGFGGFRLHAKRELEGADAGLQERVVRPRFFVHLVQLRQQIELLALVGRRCRLAADVLDQLLDVSVFRVEVGALVDAGEEASLPVLRFK